MRKIWIAVRVLLAIALAGLSANVQAQSSDEEGLVAEWHFDEGSGSVVKDSSGNGNDGVIHEATWTEKKFGSALSYWIGEFYAGSERVRIPVSGEAQPFMLKREVGRRETT